MKLRVARKIQYATGCGRPGCHRWGTVLRAHRRYVRALSLEGRLALLLFPWLQDVAFEHWWSVERLEGRPGPLTP